MKVQDHAFAETKAGTPYLTVKAELLKMTKSKIGPIFDVPSGAARFVSVYFTELTKEKSIEFLKQLGFTGGSLSQLDRKLAQSKGLPFISLSGQEFTGTIKHDTYNGKKQDKVGFFVDSNWIDNIKPANSGKLSMFDAIWRSAMAADKPKSASKPAPTQEREPGDDGPEPFAPVDDLDF